MNPTYLGAELIRRPARTLAGLVSVAVGVALFITLAAYADAYRQAARVPLSDIGANVVAQRQGTVPKAFRGIVLPHSTAPIRHSEVEAVRALGGVQEVDEAVFFWDFEPRGFVIGLGLDPASAVAARLRAGLRGGRFFGLRDHGVAVADATYAAQAHVTVGSVVDVGGHAITVVGIAEVAQAGQLVEANLYLPLGDARALVAAAPNVRAVYAVRPDDDDILYIRADPARAPGVSAQLTHLLGKTAIVTTPRTFQAVLGSTFAMIDRFGALVGTAGLVVALAGLLRTAAAGLWERRRDIGLMRAVGWRRRDVIAQVAGETLILTALGEAGRARAGGCGDVGVALDPGRDPGAVGSDADAALPARRRGAGGGDRAARRADPRGRRAGTVGCGARWRGAREHLGGAAGGRGEARGGVAS